MKYRQAGVALALGLLIGGCEAARVRPMPPSVMPTTQPSASFALSSDDIRPMYQQMMAIDLPTVSRVALAQNLDIRQAALRVETSRGQYESSVEAIFPVIAPSLAWQHFDGTNQNASGTLVSAAFNDFLPGISLQWMLNPGKVAYDVIASRRRLNASEDQEQSVLIEAVRVSAGQYYDLVLAQARLAVAKEGLAEGEELARITGARLRAGSGLQADELRAQTDLARRRQEFVIALNNFYQASVALALTLQLDASVTLVPKVEKVDQITLVRDDLSIDALLAMAAQYRPDLQASNELAQALTADKNSVVWGGLGPQLQAGYGIGGITTDEAGNLSDLHKQQRANMSAGFALGLSTFGQAKVAGARERSAAIDMQRQAEQIRAAVVSAHQASVSNGAVIPLARQGLDSAEEALRLARANLNAGTMLTIDVLQAQDALEQARLSYVGAVVRYNQSQVNLRAALGLKEVVAETAATTRPAGG